MKGVFAAVLLVASAAWGQQQITISADNKYMTVEPMSARERFIGPIPAGIKCNKYEHVEYWPSCKQGYMCSSNSPEHVITSSECVPNVHLVTEREWQDLMEEIKWMRRIHEEQCPSVSWVGGRCLPFCDEINGTGSCAYRPGQKAGK